MNDRTKELNDSPIMRRLLADYKAPKLILVVNKSKTIQKGIKK